MSPEGLRTSVIQSLTAVAPEIDINALDPDVNFRDQFELDSVDYLNFVIGLERSLGIKIPDMDYPRLSCLNGCLSYLETRSGG
jgi:acyl carrier protein